VNGEDAVLVIGPVPIVPLPMRLLELPLSNARKPCDGELKAVGIEDDELPEPYGTLELLAAPA